MCVIVHRDSFSQASLLTSSWVFLFTMHITLFFLQVKQDGFIPADLLFLASTNVDGVCYIEVCLIIHFNLKVCCFDILWAIIAVY